ncbi:MAG TPA: FAD-binding and (Fe-S)-binding domain-containing protein [Polyangia bacterium]
MRLETNLVRLRRTSERDRLHRLARNDTPAAVDRKAAAALGEALSRAIDGEVRFDEGSRALYATDASNYRQAPLGVVLPRHVEDVEATVRLARAHGAPILSRGGGTSLAGQCCNVAVVMDFSKYMHQVLEIDPSQRLARVQPGCVLDRLRDAAQDRAGLTFGPDPATHSRCTLGGMLGNNSCGSHSLLSKKNGLGLRTSDNTHALDVLLYDGTRLAVGPTPPERLEALARAGGRVGAIYGGVRSIVERYGTAIRGRFPKLGRRVSGYNLDELLPENGCHVARALVGSESTLVTILEATLHLVPAPAARTVVMLGFPDVVEAAHAALETLKFQPIACEALDDLLFEYVRKKGDQNASLAVLPRGAAFLLVELGGESRADSDAQARRMIEHLQGLPRHRPVDHKLYDDPRHEAMVWAVREGGLGSTAWVPGLPDSWPGWEDSAVPVEAVPKYIGELRALFDSYGYHPALYGHIGQGCVHCRVGFDLYTQAGIDTYRRFLDAAVALVVKHGGVPSGEHGDGQARGELLPAVFGPEVMRAFVDWKRLWDPENRMNPGKVIDLDGPAYGVTDNLRLGPDYDPPQPATHFAFVEDRRDFARAALRCVGVGACRREGGGTMCPSYMVTREEKHSTRGRARMLFEMMNGELITDGWRSEAVKDALDLCLSCKGCKGDCPVNVDMATYKAEFLSHYHQHRRRPRHAYAFGLIHETARLASWWPGLANLFTQVPGLSAIAKWLAGADRRRRLPAFAARSFQSWFRRRAKPNTAGEEVVLFPDTFNNHFHPEVAMAATRVLERAGFRVSVPLGDVCCGRPLYDYGFLDRARERWTRLLRTLRPYIRRGTPVIVLEPSCYSAFKDELGNLLPNDEDARRLGALVVTLSQFVHQRAAAFTIPQTGRQALIHGHCHQKALDVRNDKELGQLVAEQAVLRQLGIDAKQPETGCCGMAGAFGYEKAHEHYEVSVACGERVLLPEVRRTPPETLVIADGFSCGSQIEQLTGRHALHMAQVLDLAAGAGLGPVHPERPVVEQRRRARRASMARTGLTLVGLGAGIALLWRGWRRRFR